MDKAVIRIKRKSIADTKKVESQISRSQEKLMALNRKQMLFYENEQRIIEVCS